MNVDRIKQLSVEKGAREERKEIARALGTMLDSELAKIGRDPERPSYTVIGRVEGLEMAVALVADRKVKPT